MTMTRADFGKLVDANTRANTSINASMNISMNTSMNISMNGSYRGTDALNTSARKLATQDLSSSSPRRPTKVMAKLLTPNKTPSQTSIIQSILPPADNSSFSQSLPILPSHQTTRVNSSESMSNISMDEMLHESVRRDAVADEDQFSFARFLQLANIPSFNPSRCSIIGYLLSPCHSLLILPKNCYITNPNMIAGR